MLWHNWVPCPSAAAAGLRACKRRPAVSGARLMPVVDGLDACRPYLAALAKVHEAVSKVQFQLNEQVQDKLAALNSHVSNNAFCLPAPPPGKGKELFDNHNRSMFKLLKKWQEQSRKYAAQQENKAKELLQKFASELASTVNHQREDEKMQWREEIRKREEAAAARLQEARTSLRSRERGGLDAGRGGGAEAAAVQLRAAQAQVGALEAKVAALESRCASSEDQVAMLRRMLKEAQAQAAANSVAVASGRANTAVDAGADRLQTEIEQLRGRCKAGEEQTRKQAGTQLRLDAALEELRVLKAAADGGGDDDDAAAAAAASE